MSDLLPPLVELSRSSRWIEDLSTREKERVACDVVVRTIPKGGYLCRKGERVQHWIGVLDGLVKIATVSPEGKETAFAGVLAGGWFGEGSLLKDEPWHYEAVALRQTRVAYLPRFLFHALLANNLSFGRFLLAQLNERLALAMSVIENQRLLGPDARVAQCLVSLLNPALYRGAGQTLPLSQEEIGLLVGLSRQRVNQALKGLQAEGLIRTEHSAIVIRDLEGLRRFHS